MAFEKGWLATAWNDLSHEVKVSDAHTTDNKQGFEVLAQIELNHLWFKLTYTMPDN